MDTSLTELKRIVSSTQQKVFGKAEVFGQPKKVVVGQDDTEEAIWARTDGAILGDGANLKDVATGAHEAKERKQRSVCFQPIWMAGGALNYLQASGPSPFAKPVINFPHGIGSLTGTLSEIKAMKALGCHEMDIVAPVGLLRSGEYDLYETYLRCCVEAMGDAPLFVIIRTSLLRELHDEDEARRLIVIASTIVRRVGARCVKSNTGFEFGKKDGQMSKLGTEVEDVILMRLAAGDDLLVKAAGGVSSWAKARQMLPWVDVFGSSGYGASQGY